LSPNCSKKRTKDIGIVRQNKVRYGVQREGPYNQHVQISRISRNISENLMPARRIDVAPRFLQRETTGTEYRVKGTEYRTAWGINFWFTL
jgi:hypothetical protein